MDFLGIGLVELLVVLFVAFLVLGPARMIEVARSLGRFLQEVRRTTSDLPNLLTLDEEVSESSTGSKRQPGALKPNQDKDVD